MSNVNVMALTATATRRLREDVASSLGMIAPCTILLSPDKVNLRYTVVDMRGKNSDKFFIPIIHELQLKRTLLPRVIIFCRLKADCGKLYSLFRRNMGSEFMEPPGANERIVKCRLVDMFFAGSETEVKDQIIANFTIPSPLRIVICTTAFGMGVDCPRRTFGNTLWCCN